MSTTREIIETASSRISTYRSPDIDDARALLNKILGAADLGGIGDYDKISSIDFYGDQVVIDTQWMARQCNQTSTYRFPEFILDAADPVKAATIWGLEQQINEQNIKLAEAQSRVTWCTNELTKLNAKLEQAQ
jgi:hypothetical protein